MKNVVISQLTNNESRRFLKAGRTCSLCGEKITSLPISVKYKIGRSCIYNFFHIGCFLSAKPKGLVTNSKGIENLFEKGF